MVHMMEPGNFLSQPDFSKCDMQEVVINTAETASTRETNDRLAKILESTYTKSDLDNIVEAAVQVDKYQEKKVLSIIA